MAIPLTGTFGKLPLTSFQVVPPSVVRKTCPRLSTKPENPENTTYAVVELCGAAVTCVMNRGGSPVLRLFHTAPAPASAFVVTWTKLLLVPAYTVFESVVATARVVSVPTLPVRSPEIGV